MGEVLLAQDTILDRQVVLKFPRELAERDPNTAKRFLREAKAAAALDHPFICKIYESGEVGGHAYIAMEYVAGETLAARLARGPLPLRDALRTALEIAEALADAHGKGFVHRDLKPANIMLAAQGHAKVMDFGLAVQSAVSDGVDSENETLSRLTRQGVIVGTPAYMSPEQAIGKPVDPRNDVFSFGVMLYEMVSGTNPFLRPSAVETISAILHDPLPELHIKEQVAAQGLRRILQRALAKSAEDRYSTIRELAADLRELDELTSGRTRHRPAITTLAAAVALALALGAGAVWLAARRGATARPEQSPVSILIADFRNETGDAVFTGSLEQALAVGIEAASFITSYPRQAALQVASEIRPGSVLDESTARLVSIRESVKVVLAGSIEARGSGYLISVKAIDPSVDSPLFGARVTASGKEGVLEAVGSLAAKVRKARGDAAAEVAAKREGSFTAASLEAARFYTAAQDLADSYRDEEAIEHYKRAIDEDPNFGRAYAGWAYCAFRLGRSAESEAAWNKALALVERMTDREKYRTLGLYFGTQARNYEKAIESYRALLSIYPADDTAHNNLAMSYFSLRRFDEALEEGRRALEIYPQRLLYRGNHALFAMYAGDFKTAEDGARRLIASKPEYYPVYLALAVGALARSDLAAAQAAYEELARTGPPGASLSAMGLADLAAYQGRSSEAARILRQGIAEDAKAGNTVLMAAKHVALAEACQSRGEKERALAAVGDALKLRRREEVLLPVARILSWAGRKAQARELARELESQLEPQSRAYAKIIEGEIALREDRAVDALDAFKSAVGLADPWLVRFDLGVFYVQTGRYAEALAELETCEKRKGEAAAVFLDDVPTYRYLAPLPYWLGRARQGMGMRTAAFQSYSAFLAVRAPGSGDAVTEDARKRLAELGR
jgi:tetratricopeptide (TPR) repeat protein